MDLRQKQIIVTRPEGQQAELVDALQAEGVRVVHLPMIRIEPAFVGDVERSIYSNLARYDWILFTSANGVRCFKEAMESLSLDPSSVLEKCRFASVGKATQRAVREYLGRKEADWVSPKQDAQSFANAFKRQENLGVSRLLVVIGDRNDPALFNTLKGLAAEVDRICVYETALNDVSQYPQVKCFEEGHADAIIFTSPSTVRSYCSQFSDARIRLYVAIGPRTADALRMHQHSPILEVTEPSTEGIIDSLKAYSFEG